MTAAPVAEARSSQLFDRVAVLPGRLDYAMSSTSDSTWRNSNSNIAREELFVCIDDELVYARFFADFGPLNLGQTVRFCQKITKKLNEEVEQAQQTNNNKSTPRTIVLVSSDHPHKRVNAMNLLVLYLVICHRQSPEQAMTPFKSLKAPFGFRDAACGVCTFFITILDCARAVAKAIQTQLWSFETFSLDDYKHFDELHNGDINWIVPGKVLAFSGPQKERVLLDPPHKGRGRTTLLAHEYAKLFRQVGVTCVVRFNEISTYDRKAFVHAGIQHYPDGGNPSDEILYKFIRTCERESGAVAVHCKAGLGRTGTNIAAFLMMNYRFTAVEAIAWCRICRPGSIVGPQQQFLVVKQRKLSQLTPFDSVVPTTSQSSSSTSSLELVRKKKKSNGSRQSHKVQPRSGGGSSSFLCPETEDISTKITRLVDENGTTVHRQQICDQKKPLSRQSSNVARRALAPLTHSLPSMRRTSVPLHHIASRTAAALKSNALT